MLLGKVIPGKKDSMFPSVDTTSIHVLTTAYNDLITFIFKGLNARYQY